MKVRRIVSAVTAASLAFSSVAFAQSTGAQDQAQQRDSRGNYVRDPGPNRIDEQGQFRGQTQGIRQAEEARAAQQREQARTDQRNNRGYDNRGSDSRGYDNRGYDNRGYDNRGYDNRGYDNRGYGNRGYDNRGYDNRGYDSRRGEGLGFDNRGNDYRSYGFSEGGYRGQGRGIGPSQSWYRGDRLPYEYRSRHYVVDDWRSHHLYAPPRGYQWVQSGGDYVLVAVATGIIAAILLNQ